MEESGLIQLSLKNSLAKISFCDKECFNVNNNKTKEQILKHITKSFGIQVIDKQYVNITPHMIRNITHHEHILSTFTNGNPYLFWLTKIDDMPHCVFIDRKLKDGYSYPKIHVVNYKFASGLFEKDTIFTGELVKDVNRNWQYLISDILVFNGQPVKNKNVLSRFQQIYDIMDNHFTPDIMMDICQIYVKRLFQYSDIKTIFNDFIPSLSYTCKGLVFYTLNPQFSNYAWIVPKESQQQVKRKHEADEEFFRRYPEYMQHKTVFDNQQSYLTDTTCATDTTDTSTYSPQLISSSPSHNTVFTGLQSSNGNSTATGATHNYKPASGGSEFSVSGTLAESDTTDYAYLYIVKTDIPDIYNLYTQDDKLARHSIAFIPNLATSRMLYDYFKTNTRTGIIDVIAKCRYHNYFKRWIPTNIDNITKPVNTTEELNALSIALHAKYSGPVHNPDE